MAGQATERDREREREREREERTIAVNALNVHSLQQLSCRTTGNVCSPKTRGM